jgi:CubicO group peptidase (beta-lactamase class C family)
VAPSSDQVHGFDPGRLRRLDAVLHRYVDEGRLPGISLQVTRHGEVVHRDVYGFADVAARTPLAEDSIFRIYSMTKPVVSLAAMMLVEEGAFLLDNAVSRFVPEFAESRVFVGGDHADPRTEPARRPITVHDLLTHQAGLTAGFMGGPVARMYRERDLGDLVRGPRGTLAEAVARLATLPLVSHPGERWNYGMSTDVLGRVVEVASGTELDAFCARRIFEPLGMRDTGFWVPPDQAPRLVASYARTPTERLRLLEAGGPESPRTHRPRFLSGAGGLVSTVADYQRFVDLLRGGGALDGERLVSPRTVDLMRQNHLPGGRALGADAVFLEKAPDGVGFGLGFAVVIDPAATHTPCSAGEYYWGGAASTAFWIDPIADVAVIFMTQLVPSSTYPLRAQLRTGVYQALVG